MKESKQYSFIAKYGMINTIIATICVICLIVNSIIISDAALNQIASNKLVAYFLNFLAGCEGKLGSIGSMSKAQVFSDGEWWRLISHMYLHAGVLHMLFNVFALLFAGKVVEKKIGSLRYLLLYHVMAIVNAIIMCLIFPDSVSVGASEGIFGMIGIVCVMKWKKDTVCNENLKKRELIYISIFSILSLVLGL
jgi:rhomboid protease GluP